MAEGWDGYLDEYLSAGGGPDGKKAACGAALANKTDCVIYAAAPVAGEEGWKLMYAEEQDRPIMQDDGNEKPTKINEAATLLDAIGRDMGKDGPSPTGLWIGGNKHKVTKKETVEVGDAKTPCVWLNAARGDGKGAQVICTDKSVIIATFDEKAGITAGNLTGPLQSFADYMISQGL